MNKGIGHIGHVGHVLEGKVPLGFSTPPAAPSPDEADKQLQLEGGATSHPRPTGEEVDEPLAPGDPGFEGLVRRRSLEGRLTVTERGARVALHRALRPLRHGERPDPALLAAALAATAGLVPEEAS